MVKSSWYGKTLMAYAKIEEYVQREKRNLRNNYNGANLAFVCDSRGVRVFDFDKNLDNLAKRVNESGINQTNLVVMGTIDDLLDNTPKVFSMK